MEKRVRALLLFFFDHSICISRSSIVKPQFPIEIWLILPVVICLFQGLSHACLRITAFAGICAWLITSDAIYRNNFAGFRMIGYLGETPS